MALDQELPRAPRSVAEAGWEPGEGGAGHIAAWGLRFWGTGAGLAPNWAEMPAAHDGAGNGAWMWFQSYQEMQSPEAPAPASVPAEGTAGQGPRASMWHQLGHGTAREGAEPALSPPPGIQEGWGGDRTRSQPGEEGRWVKIPLQHSRTETGDRKGLGWGPGVAPAPHSPGLGAAATTSQQEGPGETPKVGFGQRAPPALPGCLSQQREMET